MERRVITPAKKGETLLKSSSLCLDLPCKQQLIAMKLIPFLFIFPFIFLSCQQHSQNDKAKQFASILHYYTSGKFRTSQKEFIDTLGERIHDFIQYHDTLTNIKHLHELLEKAKDVIV